jgi:pimeloyl-ACP methyl ester carboxylesterase
MPEVRAVLRTPEERFETLPGYDFTPHYLSDLPGFPGMRVHYLDEGPPLAEHTVLCLHGQPTWGYLYRKMVPEFVARGQRVVVPDLFGFGRSDKPVDPGFYGFLAHRQMLLEFIARLDLERITLVVQDWGGLLGLTLPQDDPDRYLRLLVLNTTLGTGDVPLTKGFLDWRAYCKAHPDLDIAALMRRAVPGLSEGEAQAYAAPFPDASFKEGVRRFPELVPDSPDAEGAAVSRRAREFWSHAWEGRSFMAIGMQDPVLGAAVMHALHGSIRGCPQPLEIDEGGHFLQEWGGPIVSKALSVWEMA